MSNYEEITEEYKNQSKAAKDELVRLQTERDAELRQIAERAAYLNECAWRDYMERLQALKARQRAMTEEMKMYLDYTDHTTEQRMARLEQHQKDMQSVSLSMADLRGEYTRKQQEIASNKRDERQTVYRKYDWKISDQYAIIKALREAYLKRIKY